MPEDQFGERFLEIRIMLLRYGGVGISYSPKMGVKRHMHLRGRIEQYVPDARFEGKPVLIRLETLSGPEWEEKIKTKEQVVSACGLFSVRANVQPRRFEEEVGDPAIQAFISITQAAFDAVSTHAMVTLDNIRRVGATIRLVGKSLPEIGTGPTGAPIHLSDLDVSEDKSYAIEGFEIDGTRTLYPRNRVLPIERSWDERGGASLSVLLTNSVYHLDVPAGRAHSIQCWGSVINAEGKPYEGADVTVKLEEFHMVSLVGGLPLELEPTDELPERALVGRFDYWPKELDQDYSSAASFSFDLQHLPDDSLGLIIPILDQPTGTWVVLNVYLMNEEGELLAATTDNLEGSVRDYNFEVRRYLSNASP